MHHPPIIRSLCVLLSLGLAAAAARAACPTGPPTCHPTNPRFLIDAEGEALYLVGSHMWNNFQDWGTTDPPPAFSFDSYLDFLAERGHNFIRGWTWEHATWIPWDGDGGANGSVVIAPGPFTRTCDASHGMALDGKPKFDLDNFDDAYFAETRKRVQAAGERDMVVGLMLFQGWSFKRRNLPGNPWRGHPFHHRNNCNGIDGDPPLDPDAPGTDDEGRIRNGLRTHSLQLPEVLAVQKRYVRRMIDELNDLDNIIWEIANESTSDIEGGRTPSAIAWQNHMVGYIKRYEQQHKPRQHLVWMSSDSNMDRVHLDESNADIISPGGNRYRLDPPAHHGPKISILDTDHTDPFKATPQVAWKSLTRGHHAIYMDFRFGVVNNRPAWRHPPEAEQERIRRALGMARHYADRMNLATTVPDPDACSTRFCLVDPNTAYLVYQDHADQEFTIDLPAGRYRLEQVDTTTSTLKTTETITWAGGSKRLRFDGQPAVFLERVGEAR